MLRHSWAGVVAPHFGEALAAISQLRRARAGQRRCGEPVPCGVRASLVLDGCSLCGRIRFRRPHRLAWLGHGPFKPATGVRIPLGVLPISLAVPTLHEEPRLSVWGRMEQAGCAM